jgi:hypothetical protein
MRLRRSWKCSQLEMFAHWIMPRINEMVHHPDQTYFVADLLRNCIFFHTALYFFNFVYTADSNCQALIINSLSPEDCDVLKRTVTLIDIEKNRSAK